MITTQLNRTNKETASFICNGISNNYYKYSTVQFDNKTVNTS